VTHIVNAINTAYPDHPVTKDRIIFMYTPPGKPAIKISHANPQEERGALPTDGILTIIIAAAEAVPHSLVSAADATLRPPSSFRF
jgi:hypothetical protein